MTTRSFDIHVTDVVLRYDVYGETFANYMAENPIASTSDPDEPLRTMEDFLHHHLRYDVSRSMETGCYGDTYKGFEFLGLDVRGEMAIMDVTPEPDNGTADDAADPHQAPARFVSDVTYVVSSEDSDWALADAVRAHEAVLSEAISAINNNPDGTGRVGHVEPFRIYYGDDVRIIISELYIVEEAS